MQAGSLSFLLSVFFSLSVLMLWFPRAFLLQEITRHSWHLQEAPETSTDRLSGACAFLGYRETRHFMEGPGLPLNLGWLFVFFFRVNLLFSDDVLPVALGI